MGAPQYPQSSVKSKNLWDCRRVSSGGLQGDRPGYDRSRPGGRHNHSHPAGPRNHAPSGQVELVAAGASSATQTSSITPVLHSVGTGRGGRRAGASCLSGGVWLPTLSSTYYPYQTDINQTTCTQEVPVLLPLFNTPAILRLCSVRLPISLTIFSHVEK